MSPRFTARAAPGARLLQHAYGHDFVRALSGPHALGRRVLIMAGVIMTVNSTLVQVFFQNGPFWPVFELGAFSLLPSLAFCVLMSRFVLPRVAPQAVAGVVLAVYVVVGLSRYLVLTALYTRFDVAPVGVPLLSAVVVGLCCLSLSTLIVDHLSVYRDQTLRLAAQKAQLQTLNATFAAKVLESTAQLTTHIHDHLDPAIEQIRVRLDSADGHGDDDGIVGLFLTAVTTIVRPMAAKLDDRPAGEPAGEQAGESVGESVVSGRGAVAVAVASVNRFLTARVDVPSAIRPMTLLLLFCAAFFVRAQLLPDVSPNPWLALNHCLTLLLLLASIRFWPRRHRILPMFGALGVLGLTLMFSAGIPAFLIFLIAPGPFAESLPYPWLSVLSFVLIGLTAMTLQLFKQIAEESAAAAAKVNKELDIGRALLARQLWISRRNLSWVLNGPIQSTLVASSLILSRRVVTDSDRERVRVCLSQAIAQLDAAPWASSGIGTGISHVAAAGKLTCVVTWSVDAGAQVLLDGDPDARVSITEIAHEAVSNAVRHGHAGRVDIHVDLLAENMNRMLRLRIENNGRDITKTGIFGLSTEIPDELSYAWELVSNDTKTVLTASVPTHPMI
jgi:hypothetical protein